MGLSTFKMFDEVIQYYNKYYGREKDEEPAKDSSTKAVS